MNALRAVSLAALVCACSTHDGKPTFRVIAFSTAKEDPAHISFVREAEQWFPQVAAKYGFAFDTTTDWRNLNSEFLTAYQVVVFLDTRPEDAAQRTRFRRTWSTAERGWAFTLPVLR